MQRGDIRRSRFGWRGVDEGKSLRKIQSFPISLRGPKEEKGLPGGSVGKESACNTEMQAVTSSVLGLGRFAGRGHGNTLQYSCLEISMDRGAWRATVHRVPKSQTRLKRLSTKKRIW